MGIDAWEEVMFVATVMDTTGGWEDDLERCMVLVRCALCCWRKLMLDNGTLFEEMETLWRTCIWERQLSCIHGSGSLRRLDSAKG